MHSSRAARLPPDRAGAPPSRTRTTGPASARLDHTDVLRLWLQHRDTHDPALRDRLVLTFAPLVKQLASARMRTLPAHVPIEELISAGLEALVRSFDRFDPTKGATLEQFLWTRIRGAMLDELRGQDWAPRSMRRTEREVRRARQDFRVIHGRVPSEEEVLEAVGLTEGQLRAHEQAELALGSVASLNVLVDLGEVGTIERGEMLVAVDGDPQAAAFDNVDNEALCAALDTLGDRERTVIGLLYFEEMTLSEVGQILGVSASRISQIHSRVKHDLAAHMTARSWPREMAQRGP